MLELTIDSISISYFIFIIVITSIIKLTIKKIKFLQDRSSELGMFRNVYTVNSYSVHGVMNSENVCNESCSACNSWKGYSIEIWVIPRIRR